MDETKFKLSQGDSLPNEDSVYRIVLNTERDRNNKMIPAIRCFTLSERDECKLSVDWSELTTPEECVARIGASFKTGKHEFKEFENRELYSISIDFLKSFDSIIDVIYDPLIYNPPEKGKPNNKAHSLIHFKKSINEDEPEIYLKIRDHAKNRLVPFNMEEARKLTNEYRNQWD